MATSHPRGPRPRPRKQPIEFLESWLHSPTAVERLFGLWAVKAGLTSTTPQYYAGPRTIPYRSLHLVLDGAVQLATDRGHPVLVETGDLFCLFPHVTYEYWPTPGHRPPRMFWLALDGPAAAALTTALGLTLERPCLRGLRTAPFLTHLPALRAVLDDVPGRRDTLAVEFLARFVGEVASQAGPDHRPGTTRSAWVQRGKDLFDAHFGSAITVTDIAERVGVDRSHFSKSFTAAVGVSPSDYLRSLRLQEGRRLLRGTDLAVTEIALSVGYSDVVAFSHGYRRRFGIAPSLDRGSSTASDA